MKHYTTLENALAAKYPFVATPSHDGDGWSIIFPDIPGVVGFAETWDGIGTEAQTILAEWLQREDEDGHPLPKPTPEWNPIQRQPDSYSIPAIYSTEEVAGLLGVSKRQVQKLSSDQNVGQRLANGLVFSSDDVEMLRKRRPPGRPQLARS